MHELARWRTIGAIPAVVCMCLACISGVQPAAAGEWTGSVAPEIRLFADQPARHAQHGHNLSVSFEPRYEHLWSDRDESLVFHPFLRLDQHDSERTHADIREFYWEKIAETWEFHAGINTVFWGVTESQHLVDIINQTDLVEDPDGEEKLGQPMLDLSLVRDWGTLDLFMLPGFRERTFPGREGRFQPALQVDEDAATYESGAEAWHVDWAMRWSHNVRGWDLGLSHFMGTSREPRYKVALEGLDGLRLAPRYDQIHQTGLDLQYATGAWLWKMESIVRSGQGSTFGAATAGFEYTFYGAFGTNADVGALAEYLYDSRGKDGQSPFDNDLFVGSRVFLNDTANTYLLFGAIVDLDTQATFLSLEASRRLSDSWRLFVDARSFLGFPKEDPAYGFRRDDYVQLKFAWYF